MRVYKKHMKKALIMGIICGVSVPIVLMSKEGLNSVHYYLVLLCGTLGFLFWLPYTYSFSITTDDKEISTAYILFGKLLKVRTKIKWDDVRQVTANDIGWFVILPQKASDNYKMKEVIYIQKDICGREELMKSVIDKIPEYKIDSQAQALLRS